MASQDVVMPPNTNQPTETLTVLGASCARACAASVHAFMRRRRSDACVAAAGGSGRRCAGQGSPMSHPHAAANARRRGVIAEPVRGGRRSPRPRAR
jgi:hypothetical protein